MQETSPYWNQQVEFQPKQELLGASGHLGFRMNIPWPMPVTVGSMYLGEGALTDRREIANIPMGEAPWGEYLAVDNVIPSAGNVPLVNVQDPIYQYRRDRWVYRV